MKTLPFSIEPLVAAWRDLGNHFSGRHAEFKMSDALTLGGILLAGATLVLLMIWMQRRQMRRERSNHPVHLFQDLCHAHGLSWRQRRLLECLADELELSPRAAVFVRPDLFTPQELPESLQSYRHAFGELRERLFADLEEPEIPVATRLPHLEEAPATVAPLPLTLPTFDTPGGSPVGSV
jgi:hypothetical protein